MRSVVNSIKDWKGRGTKRASGDGVNLMDGLDERGVCLNSGSGDGHEKKRKKKKKKPGVAAVAPVGNSGNGGIECWRCGGSHKGAQCPYYEGLLTWDLDKDKVVLAGFRLKKNAPSNPPPPPFEKDESKKFWKSLTKTDK